MLRLSPHILLYIVVMLMQMFIFDNLNFSIALTPMVYVAVVLFLPLRTSQLWMLLIGAVVGMSADLVMGLAGVNTIATIFLAYIRLYLLSVFEFERAGDKGNGRRQVSYMRRVKIIFTGVFIHHTLFFVLETLSFRAPIFLLTRILFSVAVTTIFVVLLYDIFSYLTYKRVV